MHNTQSIQIDDYDLRVVDLQEELNQEGLGFKFTVRKDGRLIHYITIGNESIALNMMIYFAELVKKHKPQNWNFNDLYVTLLHSRQ